jgi:hypothetical protein
MKTTNIHVGKERNTILWVNPESAWLRNSYIVYKVRMFWGKFHISEYDDGLRSYVLDVIDVRYLPFMLNQSEQFYIRPEHMMTFFSGIKDGYIEGDFCFEYNEVDNCQILGIRKVE